MRQPEGLVPVHEILRYLQQDRFLTLIEAAQHCGMSLRLFQRIVPESLRFRISARRVVIKLSELNQWMEQFRQMPEQRDDLRKIVPARPLFGSFLLSFGPA